MGKLNNIQIKTSKAIFLADIHFGVRSSSEEWQDNIKDYFYNLFIPYLENILKTDKDYSLFILGDVFDDRKAIDINVNDMAINIFETLAKLLNIYIINGNHDLSKKTNKGNTSLRTFTNIPGITVIQEPTILKIKPSTKILSNIIAIPYLGDHTEENKVLLEYSGKTNYAFMHTDISQMKFDNGMTIVGAVDSTIYKGKILSGHIHKRQETNNVIYIGSPYQLRRSDIGNIKGIYRLDFKTNEMSFDVNDYSPIFHKIPVDKFLKMNVSERNEFLNNNYNDILIEESELRKYKMTNIYDIANLSNAKRVQIIVNKSKHNFDVDEEKNYKELSIEELINESIMQLDIEDNAKERLKKISHDYIKIAENLETDN